jgi:hypothetical protein
MIFSQRKETIPINLISTGRIIDKRWDSTCQVGGKNGTTGCYRYTPQQGDTSCTKKITIVATSDPKPPTPPVITASACIPQSFSTGPEHEDVSFESSDPNGDNIRYLVRWVGEGNDYFPSRTGFSAPALKETTHIWGSYGWKTINASAIDTTGRSSATTSVPKYYDCKLVCNPVKYCVTNADSSCTVFHGDNTDPRCDQTEIDYCGNGCDDKCKCLTDLNGAIALVAAPPVTRSDNTVKLYWNGWKVATSSCKVIGSNGDEWDSQAHSGSIDWSNACESDDECSADALCLKHRCVTGEDSKQIKADVTYTMTCNSLQVPAQLRKVVREVGLVPGYTEQ